MLLRQTSTYTIQAVCPKFLSPHAFGFRLFQYNSLLYYVYYTLFTITSSRHLLSDFKAKTFFHLLFNLVLRTVLVSITFSLCRGFVQVLYIWTKIFFQLHGNSVTSIFFSYCIIVSLGNGFLKLFHPFFLRNMTAKTKPFIYGYAFKFVSNQSNWSHNH